MTHGRVVLREAGVADALERSDRVGAVGLSVARRTHSTLVHVLLAVAAHETVRAGGAARRHVTLRIAVTTAAIEEAIVAPRSRRASCK